MDQGALEITFMPSAEDRATLRLKALNIVLSRILRKFAQPTKPLMEGNGCLLESVCDYGWKIVQGSQMDVAELKEQLDHVQQEDWSRGVTHWTTGVISFLN